MKLAAAALSDIDLAVEIAQRNIGATTVVGQILQLGRRDILEKLHGLDIGGPQVWLLFKHLGDQTMPTFFENVERGDMVSRLAELGY